MKTYVINPIHKRLNNSQEMEVPNAIDIWCDLHAGAISSALFVLVTGISIIVLSTTDLC